MLKRPHSPGGRGVEGKRRRPQSQLANVVRNERSSPVPSGSETESQGVKKKGRFRPKTNGVRTAIRDELERVLANPHKILHLFTSTDTLGTPRALLEDVKKALDFENKFKKADQLTASQWKSISEITTKFKIEEDEPGVLYLKRWPQDDSDKKLCSVYLDNLPAGCSSEKLHRLAKTFGNVVEVRMGLQPPRWVSLEKWRKKKVLKKGRPSIENTNHQPVVQNPSNGKTLVNIGSGARPFGFVRFADPEPAKAICERFKLNDPRRVLLKSEGACKDGEVKEEEVRLRIPFAQLEMIKLIRTIRFLRLRRRRRKMRQFIRLSRLRNRLHVLLRKEETCRHKAYQLSLGPDHKIGSRPGRKSSNRGRKKPQVDDSDADASKNDEPKDESETPTRKPKAAKQRKRWHVAAKRKPHRRRKKQRRNSKAFIPGGRLRFYFAQIQVLPLADYEKLREEYLALVEHNKAMAQVNPDELPSVE